MIFTETRKDVSGIKIDVFNDENKLMGRAYLYLLFNDQHEEPFGFIEDVFVEDEFRNRGIGSHLVQKIVKVAKRES